MTATRQQPSRGPKAPSRLSAAIGSPQAPPSGRAVIGVLPGEGIGPEVTAAALHVQDAGMSVCCGGILGLVPAVMRGKHIGHPEVQHRTVASLTLRADRGLVVHADGEILAHDARELSVSVVPGALTVLA